MTSWVVVGGGAAGCVVAARLSEDADNDVTLIEAGPDHGPAPVDGDLGPLVDAIERHVEASAVVRQPDTAPVPYLQGSGLGGSTLISGSVMVADPEHPDVRHELPLEPPASLGPVGKALVSAHAAARPVLLSRRNGIRVTAADAYLRPAMSRPNLRVVTSDPVVRIEIDRRRAVGVVTASGHEHAAEHIVVCCGAIGTPKLLLRSGVDTPGVGQGLQDHPAITITLELQPELVDPAAAAITASVDVSDGQILAIDRLPGTAALGGLVGALMRVASVGNVTLPDPHGPAVVALGQFSDPADLDGLAAVTKMARTLVEHPAFRSIVTAAYIDDAGTTIEMLPRDDAALRVWLMHHAGGLHHASASCRLGVATDADGLLLGYDGIRLCDASLFPGVPVVNPYLPVITLAERIVARWRGRPLR